MLQHPLMLVWLAGAVVPLVLHLLSRSRYRAAPWGAMMFLTGIDAGPQQSGRIRQWTLLLLRMMLVGVLAVALARPVVASKYAWVPTAGLTTGAPAAVVIILDDSASMGYEQNGKSRLDQGRQITLQILSTLKRGDEAALLLSGSRDYTPPLPPSADLQSIAGRVADLQPDIGNTDFAADILKAADLLEHAAPTDREIYLICGKQASSWHNVNDAFKQQWNNRKLAGPPPRLTIIPVGGDESDNVAIDGIEFPDHAAIRDQPTVAAVRVHNYGPVEVTVPVSAWIGARTLTDALVTVPPHSTRPVSVPVRFNETGSRVLSAAVRTTGLTTDDRLDYAVDVLEPPKILVVTRDGDSASTRPTTNPAIQPRIPNRHPTEDITTIHLAEFSSDLLKKYNEIILDDVTHFSPQQLKDLKSFAATGGDVLILPGDTATAGDYNAALCGNAGILPAVISAPVNKAVHLANFDRQHAIFRYNRGRPEALTAVPVNRFFPAASRGETHTVARYNNNQPFLMEANIDRGHVLLLTTPQVDDILLQSIFRYLGTSAAVDRNLWPGQQIAITTTDAVEDRSATVQFLSDGQRDPANVTHVQDHTDIRYNKTTKPGVYRLRYRTGGKEVLLNYVVTASRNGSDLTNLTASQWSAIADRISFNRVDLSRTTIAEALNVQRGGREIWIELLGAVMVLMLVEMMLSRWWS